MADPIYLDHLATTPVDPRVLEAMLPWFTERFGNAASRTHAFGWRAEEAVEEARARVAALVGAAPAELVFTSGATEAINLALKGAAEAYAAKGRHVVTTAAEHRAVLDVAARLEARGCEVTRLPVDRTGRVDPADVAAALREDTVLVALLWASNEVGTRNPVREVGALCRERGVPLFADASQAVGKVPVDVRADHVDLLCVSGHKLYGPKGVGALYVRRKDPRVRLAPQQDGGGHERGLRSGTLNVPGIVGLGAACALAAEEMAAEGERLAGLRDRLQARLSAELDGVVVNGHPTERLPGCLNVSLRGVDAEELLRAVPELALSTGSACTSARPEPSHVLRAMGVEPELAHRSLRFGLGRPTRPEEVERAADLLVAAVRRLRSAAAPGDLDSSDARAR